VNMRILMANKYYHPAGGPEEVLLRSSEHLRSLGHTVIPFSMRYPKNLSTPYERYFVSQVDYNHHSRLPWNLAKTTVRIIFNLEAKRKMDQLVEEAQPDIAHIHNIYHQLSPSILLSLKKHRIPTVMSIHDFKLLCPNYTMMREEAPCEECQGRHFYKAVRYKCVKGSYAKSFVSALEAYFHALTRTYTRCIHRFIALSRFTQEKLIQSGLPREKIIYLPNCVEVSPHQFRAAGERYILFSGQLSDKNGILTLIKTMRDLPDIKLKVAGTGEQEEQVRNHVRENGMENVELLGFLAKDKLQEVMAKCDFLVFPNNCYHNCPMSILEAFAQAKPVVASFLGSVPELVEDGVTGLLFEPRNPRDMATKIRYLHQSPQIIERLGRNALRQVEEKHSPKSYYPKLLRLYEESIQMRKADHVRSAPTEVYRKEVSHVEGN
jgi:glycosyltransferase involved in cell wall biosynthesis